jgi:two-component system chemotaxis response regulator CheB
VPVVAIVGSAGGVGAMGRVLGQLPADLPAAVIVVLHIGRQHKSLLPQILGRATPLQVRAAGDGDRLEAGTVVCAPPNAHLLVTTDGTVRLEHSALVHHVRPSADALLLSLARDYRGPCLAVVLSGTGIDGAAGAAAVKRAGGAVVAQDEETAEHFGMPGAAILAGGVDEVLALEDIGAAVIRFAGGLP